MGNSTLITTVYVNPVVGNDANPGSRSNPYKSLTRALQDTTAKIIQLAAGTYSINSGELFPILIPVGVIVVGHEANKGEGILIFGSGEYDSQSFGRQNITLLLLSNAQLRGVTVTNPIARGTGIWIESTNPIVANNTLSNCGREGVFVSGEAKPAIVDNILVKNKAASIVIARNSQGEVLRNVLQKNALGIVVSDFAAPLLANNKIWENRIGIAVSRQAQPILKHNIVEKNSQGGLLINGNAAPDLEGNIVSDRDQQKLGIFEFTVANDSTLVCDTTGHWAEAFVAALCEKKWMSSFTESTFAPEAPITRASFAAIITKAFGLPARENLRTFTDVKLDFWAASAISSAANAGYMEGFTDGTFRPMQNLTKIQAIFSIVNGLKLSGGNPNILSIYEDRAQIPNHLTNTVAVATQKQLVVNYPHVEKLEPLKEINRGEVAALIYQALVTLGLMKPIASPYIVNPDHNTPLFVHLMGHWAEPFIRALININLTRGFADASYKPDEPMTRAQYSALVAAAFHPHPKRPVPDFTDVPKDFWAYHEIQQAASGGFVGGNKDGTFHPHQNVQRLQVIVSLVNGLALPPVQTTDVLLNYSDYNSVPESARVALATAIKHKIVVNYPEPNQIKPRIAATIGEVAAMVYQALVATGQAPAINSPQLVFQTSC
ncbi:DUF1565 domain-containing protein [Iningainema tapete]|uniref:DUF1565 domain-containing protein n=1 Tax=Iningainema tapete BLCC-T55 TaxID=2748662 RepID=A0A8J6XNW1_9CYAN|nr:DUF1565 domain-containing protein [Iningainema tapete]MBD2775354.1 DUF1565 domain-containing protein [Iningainema tapete BLCC-T55]